MRLLPKVWSSDDLGRKHENKKVIFICEEKVYLLKDKSVVMTKIPKFESDQEEIDTRVVLYCSYAVDEEYNYVWVRSPDSDIFFILFYYASKINITLLFDTDSRCKRRLLNISQLTHDFTPLYWNALLSLHAFSRWDTASAFKGIWKSEADKTPSKEITLSDCFQEP